MQPLLRRKKGGGEEQAEISPSNSSGCTQANITPVIVNEGSIDGRSFDYQDAANVCSCVFCSIDFIGNTLLQRLQQRYETLPKRSLDALWTISTHSNCFMLMSIKNANKLIFSKINKCKLS